MHEEVIYARGDDLSLYKATIKPQLLFLCVDWGSGWWLPRWSMMPTCCSLLCTGRGMGTQPFLLALCTPPNLKNSLWRMILLSRKTCHLLRKLTLSSWGIRTNWRVLNAASQQTVRESYQITPVSLTYLEILHLSVLKITLYNVDSDTAECTVMWGNHDSWDTVTKPVTWITWTA